jgi:hypothetical protein
MTDATVAALAAAPAKTTGEQIDAEIAVIKAKIAVIEAAAKTDWTKAVTWVKANALHIALTWPAAASVLYPIVKGLLKL